MADSELFPNTSHKVIGNRHTVDRNSVLILTRRKLFNALFILKMT